MVIEQHLKPFGTYWFISTALQGIRQTLADRQTSLQLDIATGRQLMESEDMPVFLSEAVTALVDTVSETTQLANLKYQSLKVIQKMLFSIMPLLIWGLGHTPTR